MGNVAYSRAARMKSIWLPTMAIMLLIGCERSEMSGGNSSSQMLFDKIPPKIRENCAVPVSEVDTATLLKRDFSREELLKALHPLFVPGREIKGWICQLKGKTLDNEARAGPSGKDFPASYVCGLKFPGEADGHEVWFRGTNYDLQARRLSVPNAALQDINEGDWVRLSGSFSNESKLKWQFVKSPRDLPPGDITYLSLGEIIISAIERVEK
jgi:hypothetical protein